MTGHDVDGKSVVASNGPLSTIRALESLPGMIFHEVWESEGTPAPVNNGPDPTTGPLAHQAPKQGSCIRFVDFPPDSSYLAVADARMKALFEEVNDVTALTMKPDSRHPMMHRSEALDYAVVIDGEMAIVLDDSEVVLGPGSVVVQRGTNHAWANRTDKVCRVLFVQIDGEYEPSIAAALARR